MVYVSGDTFNGNRADGNTSVGLYEESGSSWTLT